MKIYRNITSLIGSTPLLELGSFVAKHQLKVKILAKLESFNPSGSIKDRTAKALLLSAIEQGKINKDTVIIEPTSGNTGIALAMSAAAMGNRLVLTMPEGMSEERRQLLSAYGAKLVLTPAKEGMSGAINKALELVASIPNSFMPSQFTNPDNPLTHLSFTGPEIWLDSGEDVDIFVAGVGTGGTISGAGKFLKTKNPNIKIVAVEPEGSPVLSQGVTGNHNIQGIGAGFIPDTLDTEIYDEIITVNDKIALDTTKYLARSEGLLVGISSGAALWAVMELAKRPENFEKTIVVIFPDSGNRYLSLLSEE